MVLSEDKESYLVVADAPEPGHASPLLTTAQSAVSQTDSLIGLSPAGNPPHFPERLL